MCTHIIALSVTNRCRAIMHKNHHANQLKMVNSNIIQNIEMWLRIKIAINVYVYLYISVLSYIKTYTMMMTFLNDGMRGNVFEVPPRNELCICASPSKVTPMEANVWVNRTQIGCSRDSNATLYIFNCKQSMDHWKWRWATFWSELICSLKLCIYSKCFIG